jgi:ABC-2 type transport system ATP-binding protein
MSTQAREADTARSRHASPLAIDAHDLVKTYPKGIRALDRLSFSVETGTIFGLLGPNGAGKSTTVKILTTLARADSGAATVAGLDVRTQAAQVRRAIGVVAQRSGADPTATGRENLLLSGRIQGLRGRDLGRRADDLLSRFALADAAGRLVRTYSGGMRRRLDVAMGLVHQPGVLFLDEPTAGLDPESRSAMWEEIGRLSVGEGLTILLTTHYLEEADRLASRLAIIDRGQVVVTGTPAELKGRMQGDTVQIELAAPGNPGQVHAALERVPAIREIDISGHQVSARADDGATAAPALLAALDHAGIAVHGVTAARPTLDDVYLRFTGRRFAEAEQPAPEPRGAGQPGADHPGAAQPTPTDRPSGGSR